jgi:hypothetical protein
MLIETRCVSVERFTLDTNTLQVAQAVPRSAQRRHRFAPLIGLDQ